MTEKILTHLTKKFGVDILNAQQLDLLTITINKAKIVDIARDLYEHPEFQFQFLTDLTGIHLPEQKEELGVIYHLHSLQNNVRIRIKLFMTNENAHVHTLTTVFAGANWMERETFDFFGIHFNGHPNLKRILNVDDMLMHPMRKEFPLEDQSRKDKNDAQFGR